MLEEWEERCREPDGLVLEQRAQSKWQEGHRIAGGRAERRAWGSEARP